MRTKSFLDETLIFGDKPGRITSFIFNCLTAATFLKGLIGCKTGENKLRLG